MSFNVFYFGEDKPKNKKKLKIHILMFFLISTPYGYWADFAPSRWLLYLASGLSLLLTLFATLYICKNIKKIKNSPSMLKLSSKQKNIGLILVPLIVFCYFGLFLTYSLPAMLTISIGQDFSTNTVLTKVDAGSRKSCKYRVESAVLDDLLPSYICIDEVQFHNQSNMFLLHGKKSFLGTLYQGIE